MWPRLQVPGTFETALVQNVLHGRAHTPEEWFEYLDRFHTAVPNANETLFGLLNAVGGRSTYATVARAVAATKARRVLDLGCGGGYLMHDLLAACSPTATFDGVDMCEAEIEVARAAFPAEPRVRFQRGRAEALASPDASYDAVAAHQFFNFLPDPYPALAEAHRVLRPGGTLIFAANQATKYFPDIVAQRLFRAAADVVVGHFPDYRPAKTYDERIYQDAGILELLRDAGFDPETVTIEKYSFGAALTPQEAAAVVARFYIVASTPYVDEVLAAAESLSRSIAAENGSDRVAFELPFRIVRARKPGRPPAATSAR
ncbi:MAG TPA: class I SAM-dependent methyltransferase [Candidatus Acidoferrales bacterium]|nr:class I SAM-dependent methyltransferase [Candidatus Acidoferrales bacterium]